MEMKHNSAIKQLMREFNTQMAVKEQELSTAVKEAIGEAGKIILHSSNYSDNKYCSHNTQEIND